MRISLHKKIFTGVLALIVALTFGAFAFTAFADDTETANTTTDYFTVTGADGASDSTAELKDGKLVFGFGEGAEAEFKRDLVLNDFGVKFAYEGKISLSFFYDSYDVNGVNVGTDDKPEYSTDVELKVSFDNDKVFVGDAEPVTVSVTDNVYDVSLHIANDASGYVFEVNVNGTEIPVTENNFKPYMFGGNVVGKFAFLSDEAAADASLYVDSVSQSGKTQDFVLDSENKIVPVQSVVLLDKEFYNGETAGTIVRRYASDITVSFTEYSIDKSENKSSDFKISVDEAYENDIYFDNATTKTLRLKTLDKEVQFKVVTTETVEDEEVETVYNTFTLKGIKDETAPEVQIDAAEAKASFEDALYRATREEYDVIGENGQMVTEEHYIRLGSGNYLEIPSMERFVKDDTTPYEDLSYTVYYRTQKSDWTSTSSFKIPVASEGKYEFYVLFKDADGNEMDKDQIVDKDGNLSAQTDRSGKQGLVANKLEQAQTWQTFEFGPVLVEDGKAATLPSSFYVNCHDGYYEPRTAIGQIGPLHYIVIVVDGRREGYSTGASIPQLQQLFLDEGAEFAFNLDGGGSTTLYFRGEVINMPSGGKERSVSDIIMFTN